MAIRSLKNRIESLVSALGTSPPPAIPCIRGMLMEFAGLAEDLESGQSARDAETKIATLEAAFQQSESEKQQLKTNLEALNVEIDKLRAEPEQSERPEIEERLLVVLDYPRGEVVYLSQICICLQIAEDVADYHLTRLQEAQYVTVSQCPVNGPGWRRTHEGNKYVIAMKHSGDYEKYQELEAKREQIRREERDKDARHFPGAFS